MTPFLRLAADLIPNIADLQRVSARKPACSPRSEAVITIEGRKAGITLLTSDGHGRAFSRIQLLGNLAHELAHLWQLCFVAERSMYHTPDHAAFAAHLVALFMLELKRSGYVSEEAELRGTRKERN